MSQTHQGKWKGRLKYLVGMGVTLFCLVLFFRQVNLDEVLTALANFQWRYLFFGIGSLAVGYSFRIARWNLMLRSAGARISLKNCVAPFIGSIAMNNLLPLRLGDVVRALVFPHSMGISRTVATSSLVVERLIDLVTLLICFVLGLFAVQEVAIPEEFKTSAVTLAILAGGAFVVCFLFSGYLGALCLRLTNPAKDSGLRNRIFLLLSDLFGAIATMSRPRLLGALLLLSIPVWIGEAGLFYFVLLGSGVEAAPASALFVMSLATLATLFPSSPGYVGPFHLAAFTAVSLAGGLPAQAAGFAVLVHLALWLPTTLSGAIAICLSPELFRAAKKTAPQPLIKDELS